MARTIRRELINYAASRLRRWRANKERVVSGLGLVHFPTAKDALDNVTDFCRPGTLGWAMREYYLNISENGTCRQWAMLLNAIDDAAGTYDG